MKKNNKHKTLSLQTKTGRAVYSTGRMQFSLTKGIQKLPSGFNGDFSLKVERATATSTPVERAAFLKKVEAQIGEPLVWVKGPTVECVEL